MIFGAEALKVACGESPSKEILSATGSPEEKEENGWAKRGKHRNGISSRRYKEETAKP